MKKEALGISKEFYTVKETTQKSHYVPHGWSMSQVGKSEKEYSYACGLCEATARMD